MQSSMMGNADLSAMPPTPCAITTPTKPAGWRLVNLTRSQIQPCHEVQSIEPHKEPTSGSSAAQDIFKQRLSRFGIEFSENKSEQPSNTSNEPAVHARGGARAIMDSCIRDTAPRDGISKMSRNEDFPPLNAPTLASFTKNKRESKNDIVERQLQQARTEVQIWKAKCEAQKRDLHVSYGEMLKWRMEYEDLYSTGIRDQQIQPREAPVERHGTMSLG